jgi:four helix bundle protein
MPVQSYQDLEIWQKAMELAEQVYEVTKVFPAEEKFGLTGQMRRAAVSIPANIAEGWARRSTRAFLQFLNIASGSLRELETYVMLAQRIALMKPEQTRPLLDRIQILNRQIVTLQRRLRKR